MFENLGGLEAMFTAYLQFKAVDDITKPVKVIKNEALETAQTFNKIENQITKNTSQIANDLNKVSNAIKNISQAAQDAVPRAVKLKKSLAELTQESKKLLNFGKKISLAGGAILGSTTPFIWQAADFQKGMAEVSTLVDTGLADFTDKYQSKLLKISRDLGQDTQDVIKAFYDAISSGFSPDKALGLISQAGKSAIAGVSDIATANDTLITVLNNWKNLNLNEASDLIFKTIKYGKTTFNEIAESIGEVAPILSSVGVSFNEFSAIIATATAKGLKTGPAMTSLREVVQSLVFPTNQAKEAFTALGLTINREVLKTKGVVGVLADITKAMKEKGLSIPQIDEYLSNIFGSVEAKKIIMQFMADPTGFKDMVSKFKTTSGETQKAFEKMSQSASFQLSVLKQNIKAFSITIGTFLLPPFSWILDKINLGIGAINSFIERHQTLAKVLILPVIGIGGLIAAIGILVSVLGLTGLAIVKGIAAFIGLKDEIISVKGVLTGLPTKLKALQAQLNLTNISIKGLISSFYRLTIASLRFAFSPAGIGLMLLGVAIYAVINNLEVLKAGFNNAFGVLKVVYSNYIEPFIEGFKIGLTHLEGAFEPIKIALMPIVNAFRNLFNVIFGGFKQAIFSNEAFLDSVETGVVIGKAFAFVIKGALQAISPILWAISEGIGLVVNGISFLIGLVKKVYSWFNELPTPLKVVIATALTLAIPFLGVFRVLKLLLLPIRAVIGLLRLVGSVAIGLRGKLLIAFGVFGIVKNVWNNALEFLKELWNRFVNFIYTGWQQVLKGFLWINPIMLPIMLINKLVEKLTGINLFEIGKNIVLGLVRGLKEGFSHALETIKNIGTGIISKFKGLFGINSPSTLFKQFGSFLIQGLNIGMIKNISLVSGAFEKIKGLFKFTLPLENNKNKPSNILERTFKKEPITEKTSVSKQSPILHIGKIIINYEGIGDIKEDSKAIANEVIFALEDFLERS